MGHHDAPVLFVFFNVYKHLKSSLCFFLSLLLPSAYLSRCHRFLLCHLFLPYHNLPIISFHILPPLPCCSVPLFPTSLLSFTSPDLLFPTTNTLLFSRALQGHCEITYFTDNLSCVTLFTHQTADPLTLSLCLPKPSR